MESSSDAEFRASVVGAYERGERAISVPRLKRLAELYTVPVEQLLPGDDPGGEVIDLRGAPREAELRPNAPVVLDLVALGRLEGAPADALRRLVGTIQVERQDFNGRMLSVRGDDLRAVAAIIGVPTEAAHRWIADTGLLYSPVASPNE